MGNQQTKPQNNSIKRKHYSFDAGDFTNFSIDKIKPTNAQQNNISSSLDIRPSNSMHEMPSLSKQLPLNYVSSLPKLSIKQQNAKLQKLTKTNDQLRKQLMQINKKLAQQLQRKKMPTLMSSHTQKQKQKSLDKDKHKIIALKKQLQNAYSQSNMYKKQIQVLKKNDSHQSQIKLQSFEDKISSIDSEIAQVEKSLQSIKVIVKKQQADITKFQQQLTGEDIQENRKQITMLKDRLKQIKQLSRKKEKDEKMRHELLIQMERKLREINLEYVPEFKNWAVEQVTTKSRVISTRLQQQQYNKKHSQTNTINKNHQKQQKQFRYLPSKLQLQQVENQLKKQKQTHEQFHKKIDNQLQKRNSYKQQRLRAEEKLQSIYKTLQNLQYKKDRYMQLIMGNVSLGAGGVAIDELLSVNGDEQAINDEGVIVKGEHLQGQVEFTDRKVIKNYYQVVDKLKIVTLNVWVNQKGHIVSFQFYYTDGESFFVGNKSPDLSLLSSGGSLQKHTLQLQQNDYIKNVMGIFNSKNKFLEFIVFESLKGKVLKVGKQSFKNTNFNLRIAKGQRPAMISGACVNDGGYWRINRLEFVIVSG